MARQKKPRSHPLSGHPEIDAGNVGMICDGCVQAMMPTAAELARPPQWFIGQYVQLAFPIPNTNKNERMWVKVIGLAETEGEELRGELNNNPLFVPVAHGDLFEFKRSEIVKLSSPED